MKPATAQEVAVRSPGRVNLIGEHTDYNGGWVLPMAINRQVTLRASKLPDGRLAMHSQQYDSHVELEAGPLALQEEHGWANYVKAVLWALREKGLGLGGYEFHVDSNLWKGGGLSSSAALELAVARAVCALDGVDWDPLAMALLCQRAENEFIGVKCGIMDQAAVALSQRGHALLLNCSSLEYKAAPLNFPNTSFVVTNSAVERGLKGGEYNQRRQGCEAALKALQSLGLKISGLAQLEEKDFKRYQSQLPDASQPLARHVVTETRRTLQGIEAMRQGDAAAFGKLMLESHISLRDDYRVSCAELDTLVDGAMALPGVYGSRLTGAGFGGCTVSLVSNDHVDEFCAALPKSYRAKTGLEAGTLVCQAADAAGLNS